MSSSQIINPAAFRENVRSKLIEKFGIIGSAAGSIFVYKGKLKGVLIIIPIIIPIT